MHEHTLDTVKKKAIKGVVALTSRTFVLQIIAFTATSLLGIFLNPDIFGVYYLVTSLINFLGYFSDIGLAAALIQKKESLTESDLTTTFTIQQLLIGSVSIIMLFLVPFIKNFYKLDSSAIWLLYALLFSFCTSSLKTIPSILLERALDFNKLIIPQVLETLAFYGLSVTLAMMGFGVTSFTYAVVIRAIVGLVSLYIVAPWKIRFGISRESATQLLKYGVPVQLNGLLALLKDDLMTLFLGKLLPLSEVGYLGWAKKWSEVPLRLIMDSAIRVTFPAYARVQDSKEVLGRAIEKTLFGISLLLFPLSTTIFFCIQPLIHIVPRYEKWNPALFSFYLFTFAAILSGFTTPLINALNAIGKIKKTMQFMIIWTILTWLGAILLIPIFSYKGYSLTILLVSSTIFLVVREIQKYANFSFIRSIQIPLFASLLLGFVYYICFSFIPLNFITLSIVILVAIILYGALVYKFEHNRITDIYLHLIRK